MSTNRTRALLGAAVLAAVLGACSVESDPDGGPVSNSGNTEHPPVDDVAISECTTEQFAGPVARGTLTNHSSKTSNYMISVNFTDPSGTVVAQGTAFANNIPPGVDATWEAMSFADGVALDRCVISAVDRFSAVG